jgi:uncharacterized protein YaiI (UPF0178 family)
MAHERSRCKGVMTEKDYVMKILVDADAFPNVIKDMLFRAARRHRIPLILVANQQMNIKKSPYISCIAVPAGPDVADDRIVELVQHGDLVITADIPLADRVVSQGAYAINPRGELYTEENIKDRLAVRDLMNELRNGGIIVQPKRPSGIRQSVGSFSDQTL